MKITTAVLLGMCGWAAYELYKNRTYKATIGAMKNDMMALRAKVAKMAKGDDTTGTSLTSKNDVPSGKEPVAAIVPDGVTGVNNSAWNGFVGQPLLTQIVVPNDPRAVRNYSGTSYDGIFRKKPVAFCGWGY